MWGGGGRPPLGGGSLSNGLLVGVRLSVIVQRQQWQGALCSPPAGTEEQASVDRSSVVQRVAHHLPSHRRATPGDYCQFPRAALNSAMLRATRCPSSSPPATRATQTHSLQGVDGGGLARAPAPGLGEGAGLLLTTPRHPEGERGCPPPPGGVVKQDKSSGGSVDTTKTRSGPQRVRMSSGERPIGAAKGKQSDTEALCQPPPPPPGTPPLRCKRLGQIFPRAFGQSKFFSGNQCKCICLRFSTSHFSPSQFASPPPPLPYLLLLPPEQSDHRGKTEFSGWGSLVGPFLVHELLGPRTPPPPSLLFYTAARTHAAHAARVPCSVVEYISRSREEGRPQESRASFHMQEPPEALTKKITLIKYFKCYLQKAKGPGPCPCPFVFARVLLPSPLACPVLPRLPLPPPKGCAHGTGFRQWVPRRLPAVGEGVGAKHVQPQHPFFGAAHGGFEACRSMPQHPFF